ncbi:MAG: glycosyltransferase family 4 protein [Planctomycetota bacterium]
MKILLVNDAATPLGGAEHMTLSLREAYRRRGHDALIFASTHGQHAGPCEADMTCRSFSGPAQGVARVYNPWAASAFRRAVKEFDPDVVHVRMFLTQLSPAIMPMLKGRPHLYHATDYMMVCPSGHMLRSDGEPCRTPAGRVCRGQGCVSAAMYPLISVQLKTLWRRLKYASAIVANSHNTKAMLEAGGVGPARVIWNGCDPTPARPPLEDDAVPTAVCVSRLEKEKGVQVLIEAFGQAAGKVPAARLVIAGDGSMRGELEARVAELGLSERVTFLGRVGREQQTELFKAAWVQVAPSLWREPFGIVAVEAAFRGTAAIVTGGGLAEIVEDGRTGYVVPMGDAEAMADRLVTVLSDRELAESLGRRGRERAERHFTLDTMAEQFLELYREIAPGVAEQPGAEDAEAVRG